MNLYGTDRSASTDKSKDTSSLSNSVLSIDSLLESVFHNVMKIPPGISNEKTKFTNLKDLLYDFFPVLSKPDSSKYHSQLVLMKEPLKVKWSRGCKWGMRKNLEFSSFRKVGKILLWQTLWDPLYLIKGFPILGWWDGSVCKVACCQVWWQVQSLRSTQ